MTTLLVTKISANGKLESSKKTVIRQVKHRYVDGTVQDHIGDVWAVVPCSTDKADLTTVQ
jgi:hypothetical protein